MEKTQRRDDRNKDSLPIRFHFFQAKIATAAGFFVLGRAQPHKKPATNPYDPVH